MSGAVQLDFSKTRATDVLLPNPAALISPGWDSLHFELHRQPTFDTPEHQSPWHVIAQGFADDSEAHPSPGERWLDGKLSRERRQQGDIAIIPAAVSQRCNWSTTAEFAILAVEPALLKQVGQEWVDGDRIELMPQFMSEQAKFLLQHSELSLADIAVRVGFCDQSHLTRCFKRLVGTTPKQFRKPIARMF